MTKPSRYGCISFSINEQSHKIVIIGAGVSGLTAAHKLFNMGIEDFLVLESEDVVGGNAGLV
jgi:cation diffusion facilitator CzcD-associated flavoprotein CzcO